MEENYILKGGRVINNIENYLDQVPLSARDDGWIHLNALEENLVLL